MYISSRICSIRIASALGSRTLSSLIQRNTATSALEFSLMAFGKRFATLMAR